MAAELNRKIAGNLARVEARLAAACMRAGRQRSEVTLVAVSKTRSLPETIAACACGVRHLGENRVEELQVKVPALAQCWQGEPPIWHMIGHLQSRKVRDVVSLCQVLHSLDSLVLATKLEAQATQRDMILPVLLECNVSGEPNKYGFHAWEQPGWPALAEELLHLGECKHLQVRGLMTMAPIVDEPQAARPYFSRLRELRAFLQRQIPGVIGPDLSMGMTDDFEIAAEEGATLVRIGRAIFD
ncbi:MAG: YggS family pyridoxal phosphate-dependent enzyme [Chloroflexi bacterium]|nr:YggS family pyridoxal phosphate-dependent enzyme [Chloroflexota bacterium]